MPGELLRTLRLYRQVKAAGTRDYGLPRTAKDARSLLYLRTEPKLRLPVIGEEMLMLVLELASERIAQVFAALGESLCY